MTKVKCPNCGKQLIWDADESPFRPFCSDRCRLIDLGAWANEDYQVPGAPVDPMHDISENQSLLH